MTFEELKGVNDTLKTTNIKGKPYVEVYAKVQGFRKLYPSGNIDTNIVSIENGVCIIQAKAYDENGNQLGSGIAYEKEGSSDINKTSYIENCETSAIGRALSSVGIGSQDAYASAIEVENAINNQKETAKETKKVEYPTAKEKNNFIKACEELKYDPNLVLKQTGWKSGKATKEQLAKAEKILDSIREELDKRNG